MTSRSTRSTRSARARRVALRRIERSRRALPDRAKSRIPRVFAPRLASSHAQFVALRRRARDVRAKRRVALRAVVDTARDPTREKSHGVAN